MACNIWIETQAFVVPVVGEEHLTDGLRELASSAIKGISSSVSIGLGTKEAIDVGKQIDKAVVIINILSNNFKSFNIAKINVTCFVIEKLINYCFSDWDHTYRRRHFWQYWPLAEERSGEALHQPL